MPSPQTYNPKQFDAPYKSRSISNHPERCTIFSSLEKYGKKYSTPSPSDFDLSKRKSQSLGKFDKSENVNYLDAVSYNSAQQPGVGEYQLRSISLTKLGRWDKAPKKLMEQGDKMNK